MDERFEFSIRLIVTPEEDGGGSVGWKGEIFSGAGSSAKYGDWVQVGDLAAEWPEAMELVALQAIRTLRTVLEENTEFKNGGNENV